MNIELKPRTPSFFVPAPAPNNDDNADRLRQCGSPSRRALIYQRAKSTTTSGRAGTKHWLLEFEPKSAPFVEPLMGWTGSTDPLTSVRLAFPSREAAVAYAERQGFEYEVRESSTPKEGAHRGCQTAASANVTVAAESQHTERNRLPVAEIGPTAIAAELAA